MRHLFQKTVIGLVLKAVAQTHSVENLRLDIEYEFEATPSTALVLSDGQFNDGYAPSQLKMMECLQKLKRANSALRNAVCSIHGLMEYDMDTMCTLMDFHYHARSQSVAAQQDAGDVSIPDANATANVIAAEDEISYHFCHRAVMMLCDALWENVEDRESVDSLFEEFDEDMFAGMWGDY